jgi:predicted dehydrogenase
MVGEMRVALVGARRVRQGTGPFLARFLRVAGAEVVAVLGTRAETAAESARALAEAGLGRPEALARADDLFGRKDLDALVVASPPETHAALLERALARGLHALCEKPLCWGGADPAGEAESLARRFLDAGLTLRATCQWPFTLPAYEELHGAVGTPRRFRMRLSPSTQGARMLVDSLSHPLSLLHAVLPDAGARVEEARVDARDDGHAQVRFVYRAAGRSVDCAVLLVHSDRAPRAAGYGFDGHWVERETTERPYRTEFVAQDRRVPLPDPLEQAVKDFVEGLRAGRAARVDPAAIPGQRHLGDLVAAWPLAHPVEAR